MRYPDRTLTDSIVPVYPTAERNSHLDFALRRVEGLVPIKLDTQRYYMSPLFSPCRLATLAGITMPTAQKS